MARLERTERCFELQLQAGNERAHLEIYLLAPEDWALRTRRPAPAPLSGPPPLPPRLG